MNHLKRLLNQVTFRLFVLILFSNVVVIACYTLGATLEVRTIELLAGIGIVAIAGSAMFAISGAHMATEPLRVLWQAILHVTPEHSNSPPPNLEQVRVGRELVTSLALEVYQLASGTEQRSPNQSNGLSEHVVQALPLPLIALSNDSVILFANELAGKYFGTTAQELAGKNIYNVLDMAFPTEETFDTWLQNAQSNTITDRHSWIHVKAKTPGLSTQLQFDLAASYNKGNPSGAEVLLSFYDQTERYNDEDNDLGFVSMAVHELRTPVTLMRGYIEVFEEELEGKLDAELHGFLHKMKVSAGQLSDFVNNILNVARVEENQLTVHLTEENWEQTISAVVADLALRAQVHQKTIQYSIDPKIPPVAIDRVSIYEVLSNLVDNAIKYSGQGQADIVITSRMTKDGLVETTVQDFGIGIPASVMPHLFSKFYRNHRTRAQVGGTGLGLYLCKALITAHGGNIWIRSHENEGTTVGFTVQPYALLSDAQKNTDTDIVRSAHGWIKNHSLYRD